MASQGKVRMMRPERRRSHRQRLGTGVALALLGGIAMVPARLVAEGGKLEKVLFVSNRAGERTFNIFTMNPDGSEQLNLTRSDAIELDPIWSPDRTRIAFAGVSPEAPTADIYVMNADGSQRTRLTRSEARSFAVAPAWTPDGKRIAYSTFQPAELGSLPQTTLYVMDADGKNNKKLGRGLLPVWSPDGSRIAYAVFLKEHQGGAPDLYLMDADGRNVKRLAERAMGAAWSPDGRRLLYIEFSNRGGDQSDMFVVNADGTQPIQLTTTPDLIELAAQWSSDGKRIFFTAAPNGMDFPPRMQVYEMNANGTHVKPLTQGDALSFLGASAGLFVLASRIELR